MRLFDVVLCSDAPPLLVDRGQVRKPEHEFRCGHRARVGKAYLAKAIRFGRYKIPRECDESADPQNDGRAIERRIGGNMRVVKAKARGACREVDVPAERDRQYAGGLGAGR